MCSRALTLSMVMILLTASTPSAATWHVPAAAPTIQAGLDSAAFGDTVLVAPGTYRGDGNRDLDFGGKDIVLMSAGGSEVTIMDCQGSDPDPHRGIHFHGGETPAAVVEGFTIKNGYPPSNVLPDRAGGGILVESGCSPTIRSCVFRENIAGVRGGGVALFDSHASVEDCSFEGNYADGGGVCCVGGEVTFSHCRFSGNGGNPRGGGMRIEGAARVTVSFSDFVSNSANELFSGRGGGISAVDSSLVELHFCTFVSNSGDRGGAISMECTVPGSAVLEATECLFDANQSIGDPDFTSAYGGAIYSSGSPVSCTSCVFIENRADTYCCTARGGAIYSDMNVDLVSSTFYDNYGRSTLGGVLGSTIGATGAAVLTNCIITNSSGGEPFYCGTTGSATLTCCDVFGNEGGDYVGCLAGQLGINGNFSADPLFCDPEARDLTLDASSPCLAAPGCGLVGALGQGCGEIPAAVAAEAAANSSQLALAPGRPNPFNPLTAVTYAVPPAGDPSPVRLNVYDARGRLVRQLVDEVQESGEHTAYWDGTDHAGRPVASGIYFCELRWRDECRSGRLVVAR